MAQHLSNLPIGAKIKFAKYSVNGETAQDITWLIVAKNHSGYPSNSITLLTDKIIDLRAMDAREPDNPTLNRNTNGSNDYMLSNIDQWLNSESGVPWYTARTSYDKPPNNSYTLNNTGYENRPGFLSNFTDLEKSAIITSTISVIKYDSTSVDSQPRKIFLPSIAEVGIVTGSQVTDGALWEYFTANGRATPLTPQCFNHTQSDTKPSLATDNWAWWCRSAVTSSQSSFHVVSASGTWTNGQALWGKYGIRPAVNVVSTLLVSDTTDSEGCYNVTWNSAPPVPTTLNVPSTIYGGKSTTISWSSVTDPDGQAVTYQLEQSIAGGAFTTIYSGSNLSYTTTVAFGTASVQFRLKAIDTMSASSGYITSTSRTVINNYAPTISGSDGSLGTKNSGFTQTYTIGDANSNSVTVTESIDGVQLRSYVATLNATNTFSVTGNTWVALANGTHTLTIKATDGIDSSTRTFTFVKSVSSFTVQNNTPYASSTMPVRIKVSVSGNIPVGATKKIEVCNNGFDSSPTWEDASTAESGGLIHVFTNKTKTATQWGVLIRVTVNRNGASGACYITSIGGNFE